MQTLDERLDELANEAARGSTSAMEQLFREATSAEEAGEPALAASLYREAAVAYRIQAFRFSCRPEGPTPPPPDMVLQLEAYRRWFREAHSDDARRAAAEHFLAPERRVVLAHLILSHPALEPAKMWLESAYERSLKRDPPKGNSLAGRAMEALKDRYIEDRGSLGSMILIDQEMKAAIELIADELVRLRTDAKET